MITFSFFKRLYCFKHLLLAFFIFYLFQGIVLGQQPIPATLDSLIKLLDVRTEPVERTQLLNDIAFSYLDVDISKGLEYAQQALSAAEEYQFEDQIARAYNSLGSFYLNTGNYERSVEMFDLSLTHYQKSGDELWVANVLGNIGVLHYFKGDFAGALDYKFQALKIFEKIDHKMGVANEMNGIGSIYMEQKKYEKAIYYDTLSLNIYKELNDLDGEALILGNLANIYENINEREKAKKYCDESINIYKEIGNPIGVGRNLTNLATIYQDEGNYVKSLELLEEAYQIFKDVNMLTGVCYTSGNLGISYVLSHENYGQIDSSLFLIPGTKKQLAEKGIFYLEQAVELSQQAGELNAAGDFSESLSGFYEILDDYENAYKYYKIYSESKDSVHSVESKINIEKLTTEREVELKNKQIELDRLAVQLKRNERLYFGIGMGLLALSMLFIYRNYSNQKKSNVVLTSLNNKIADTNTQLEDKNTKLSDALQNLKKTQDQLIVSEKLKENALIRSRISQDIHDDISSGLTKISWLTETVIAKSSLKKPIIDVSLLQKINHFSKESVANLGEIIWSSNPDRDNLISLLAYMRNYIHKYMEDSPIKYKIHFPKELPDTDINPELRRNLFLVMKEALHNAMKYSQAQNLFVSFKLDNNGYQLNVSDDGIGMEEGVVKGTGNGLLNMKRRMAVVKGKMDIKSAPGEGATFSFTGELY